MKLWYKPLKSRLRFRDGLLGIAVETAYVAFICIAGFLICLLAEGGLS